jgi:flavin reductase (DIM6/NTAB) family NADH-FMN oxidoreductase RutF
MSTHPAPDHIDLSTNHVGVTRERPGSRSPGLTLVRSEATAAQRLLPDSVDPATYRSVFRRSAGAVSVITADDGTGPVGFTVTSVVSVSISPPMVSFAISNASSSFPTVARAASVVINFLSLGQHMLATTFAARGINRFAEPTRWSRLADGSPVLEDAPTYLHGRVQHRFPVGDHHIVVAELTAAEQRRHYEPLVYHAGGYGSALVTV